MEEELSWFRRCQKKAMEATETIADEMSVVLNEAKDGLKKLDDQLDITAKLKEAGDKRDQEPSKRWQAHYDYCLARLQSRLVFIYEYNFVLAQVRSDSLPALEQVHNAWRIGSRPKVQVSEGKVKTMAKEINKAWERIGKNHPGTPWAVLARREQMTSLGLEWRPSRD